MARIRSYPYDPTVTSEDAWVGTDAVNRRTKQFTAEAVAEYVNISGKISIGGEVSFNWDDGGPIKTGTISLAAGGGSGDNFNTLTSVLLSIKEVSGQNVVKWLEYITTKNILLGQGDEISQFGHYTLDTYAVSADPNFYTAGLTYIGGNGTIVNNTRYSIIVFDQESTTGVFPFNANTNPFTVTINHQGLQGSYPSVTVVTTSNRVVFGEINYTSTTQLTITFSKAFSGTVYTN